MVSKRGRKNKKPSPLPIIIGIVFLIAGFIIPISTYFPVVKAEINYRLKPSPDPVLTPTPIEPVDREFSLIIPKINANARVIKDVDPYNAAEYQLALTKGVAHAATSALPNEKGNTFIFAHSAGNWYQANQFNAVFYLLNKLVKGDEIIVYYKNKDFHYTVSETKLVKGSEVNYLKSSSDREQLTLMTCWPPGTTLKRLIVIAKLSTSSLLPIF